LALIEDTPRTGAKALAKPNTTGEIFMILIDLSITVIIDPVTEIQLRWNAWLAGGFNPRLTARGLCFAATAPLSTAKDGPVFLINFPVTIFI